MLELKRKLLHLSAGIVLAILVYYDLFNLAIFIPLLVFGFILSLLSKKYDVPVVCWLLNSCERYKDRKILPGKGALTLLAGAILAVLFFDKLTAFIGILVLAVADSVSLIVGQYIGKTTHFFNRRKMVEGTIAGIFLASIVVAFFIHPLKSLIVSSVAMFFEIFEHKFIDDNVVIPLVVGAALKLLAFW